MWSLAACFALFRARAPDDDHLHDRASLASRWITASTLSSTRNAPTAACLRALRDIRRPLIAGCLTSVGGFIVHDVDHACPCSGKWAWPSRWGLIFSLTLDFLYLPWMPALRPSVELPRGEDPHSCSRLTLGGCGLSVVRAPGWSWSRRRLVFAARIRWSDDVRTLQGHVACRVAKTSKRSCARCFGQSRDQHIILTFGPDLDTAFANLEKFNAHAERRVPPTPADRYFNLGRNSCPPPDNPPACRDYFRAHPEFTTALHVPRSTRISTPGAFDPFWRDWDAWLQDGQRRRSHTPTPARLLDGLRDVLPLPLQNLWNDEQPGSRLAGHADQRAPARQTAAEGPSPRPNAPIRPGGKPSTPRIAPLPRDGDAARGHRAGRSSRWRC